MGDEPEYAGDPIPPNHELIEVRVVGLKQLFNSMDASPFRERDLDPDAEEFIVGWAREAPPKAKLALQVALERAPGLADEPAALRDAIAEFFAHRAQASRRRLRELLRIGRISLLVGVVFLTAAVGVGDLIASMMKGQRVGELLREGFAIVGWVAMWRPIEIFLYGWWPLRREGRLYDRLSAMPVRIAYKGSADPGAWRDDWPAVPSAQTPAQKSPPSHRSGKDNPEEEIVIPERGPIAATTIAGVHEQGSKKGGS